MIYILTSSLMWTGKDRWVTMNVLDVRRCVQKTSTPSSCHGPSTWARTDWWQ